MEVIASKSFEAEMLESEVAQHVARGALTLYSMGRNINILQIMSVVGQRVTPTDWLPVSRIFQNGYGNVDAALAVDAVRSAYKVRRTQEIVAEMQEKMTEAPADVEMWLPDLQDQLRVLNETGQTYDARPSTIYQDEIPVITFTCLIEPMNKVIRGGYRSGMFLVYCGVSGHGKSTSLYTHAVDVLTQGRTVSFVSNERTRRVVLDRILRGCSKLTESEVALHKGNNPERQKALETWIRFVDERLRIYDRHYKSTTMAQVFKNDKSDLGIIDYLMNQEGMLPAGKHDDPTGDMAYFLMNLANEQRMTIMTAAQMSNSHAEAFLKDSRQAPQIAYGTARPYHASNLWIACKRDEIENWEYMRVVKDNLANMFDTEHHVPFDPYTWTYTNESAARAAEQSII